MGFVINLCGKIDNRVKFEDLNGKYIFNDTNFIKDFLVNFENKEN